MNRAALAFLAFLAIAQCSMAAPFTLGNLVVYRVGDVTIPLTGSAAPVFLDEFSLDGTLVQSIALPTVANGSSAALTAGGNQTTEGLLQLSEDGFFLTLTGYDAPVGTPNVHTTTSAAINRVVGLVDSNGNIDTTTRLPASFSETNIRSAVSSNGTDLWIAGGGTGLLYTTKGSTNTPTIVSSTSPNLRTVDIFAGQLFTTAVSGSFRIGTVGSGLPTTAGVTTTSLPGIPTAAYNQLAFFDLSPAVPGLDTLYVSNDSDFGITKFSLVGGTWVNSGLIFGDAMRGVTATSNGSTVSIYATGANTLYKIIDTSGYNAAPPASATVIATTPQGSFFRGVDFAPKPVPEPSTAGIFALGAASLMLRRRR